MDSVNTSVDTNKHLYDELESIEHLHDTTKHAAEDHGTSKEYDVDFLNLEKSPSNGMLDSYHENISPEIDKVHAFLVENDLQDQSMLLNKEHDTSDSTADTLKNEDFCGTDKLNMLSDFVANDDVEEFIPSKNLAEKPSLKDFDPLTDSVYNPEDDFRSYTDANLITRTTQSIDTVEPVTRYKELKSSETLVSLESAVKSDKDISDNFKEIIDDSPRTGTPDFLELDSDDFKPIDVKTKSVTAPETKPVDTKPMEVKPLEPKPIEKVSEKVFEIKKEEKPKVEYFPDKPEIGPKEIFSKYGLDIWFKPERLNPTVEAFIYWRDPKLSAIVFVSGLVLLLSMAYYSLISVVANTGLTILVLAMGFRIYKHILQAVQKTDQGHPYSVFLEWDLKLPQEKVHDLVDTMLIHINAYVSELRRLFLIENLMESVRFAVVLWVLTYVGSWFNGLTLVIIAFVSLFTLPKVYENNKVQIDQNLALVHAKLEELTNKIKDVLPALLRKKLPEKKE